MKIVFVLANVADPDEMPHYVAFHLGLHCLSKQQIGVSGPQSVDFIQGYVNGVVEKL